MQVETPIVTEEPAVVTEEPETVATEEPVAEEKKVDDQIKPENPEAENMRKIFTGGLNRETTDDEMKAYFGKFGEITDCIILKDSNNNSK